jgi:hypothetical protein
MLPWLWVPSRGGDAPAENDGQDAPQALHLPWEIQPDGAGSAWDERFDVSLLGVQPGFTHLFHSKESTSDIHGDPDIHDLQDLPSIAPGLPVGSPLSRSLVASIDDDRPDKPTAADTTMTKRVLLAQALSTTLTIRKLARRPVWTCSALDCSYSSDRKGNLERHVRTSHTNERPYMCETCSYTSADASAVGRHERQHSGKAPAICNFPGCDYKATDFSNLKRHLRVHTGERPFECSHCPYTSAQSGSISSHVARRHSTVRAFTCSHCSYAAKTLPDLKKHEMRHC